MTNAFGGMRGLIDCLMELLAMNRTDLNWETGTCCIESIIAGFGLEKEFFSLFSATFLSACTRELTKYE